MKIKTAFLFLLFLVPISCGPTGFLGTGILKSNTVQSVKTTVAQLADAYSGAATEVVNLRNEGTIKKGSDLDKAIRSADNRAYAALKSAQDSANAGVTIPQATLDAFYSALADMKVKKADAVSTTQPS